MLTATLSGLGYLAGAALLYGLWRFFWTGPTTAQGKRRPFIEDYPSLDESGPSAEEKNIRPDDVRSRSLQKE